MPPIGERADRAASRSAPIGRAWREGDRERVSHGETQETAAETLAGLERHRPGVSTHPAMASDLLLAVS